MALSSTLPVMTTQSAPDLTSLLRHVAQGHRDSLAELYRQVERPVYAFALSRLADPDAAGDLLHEVMLAVWQKAGSFGGRSRALTWILGITHHKIVDRLRRAGRWQAEPPDEALGDDSPSPHDLATLDQRREAVREAVASLPDHHRQVVHLAFFEDLSYPEVARILDIPEGTVKTRMFHAKKALVRRLRSHVPAEGVN